MLSGSPVTRRRALALFIGTALTSISAGVAAIAGRFLWGKPPAGSAAGRAISVGKLDELPALADPVERSISVNRLDGYFSETRRERIFLWRDGSTLRAFSSTCTHLGCAVSWDPGSRLFRCPCHGGLYRPDGTVAGGPPPRPLEDLPIEIRQGEIFVRGMDRA
jgi:Rieske Fe-S protein